MVVKTYNKKFKIHISMLGRHLVLGVTLKALVGTSVSNFRIFGFKSQFVLNSSSC